MIKLKENIFLIKSNPLILITLILIQIFLFSTCVQSKTYDPSLNWQVTESTHFLVIFPGESPLNQYYFDYSNTASNVLEIAEATYEQITPNFGEPFHKNRKIAIILEDFSDSVYGFATVLPHRLIRINLTAPNFKSFDTKFENWLKIVITHEYTHLAHFEMTAKTTSFLRFFLGQIIAPNALQPMWATEGMAIYYESQNSSGGRLQDTRYDMYLRSDFLKSEPIDLKLLQSSYLTSWPAGTAPYVYGQSLVHYIAAKFGEENLIKISEYFCAYPLLGMNWAIKKTLNIDQEQLYQEWQEEQFSHYQKQAEEVYQNSSLTASDQITNHKYWVDNPIWLTNTGNNSTSILYRVNNLELYPTIRSYSLNSKEESIIINRVNGHGFSYSLSPDNLFLLYTRLSQYEQYYQYSDIFLYSLQTGKQLKISDGMRIKDPSWNPDKSRNQVVAVINNAGTNNLVLFSVSQDLMKNLNTGSTAIPVDNYKEGDLLSFSDLIYLTDFKDGTQISHPVWSPDGSHIALSLWQNGYQDIYILALDKDNQIESSYAIAIDNYTDISPSWSADGKHLYFSSDRTGIYNLYAYSIEDKELFRMTNVLTGAFEPAVSPCNNYMAFIQYHPTGYELHLSKTEDLLWEPVDHTDTGDSSLYQTLQGENRDTENRPLYQNITKPYSPWDSILPTYWTPYLTLTRNDLYLGFSSIAQDYLQFYNLPFTIAKGLMSPAVYYDISLIDYANNNPIYSLSWQGETLLEDNRLNNFLDPESTTSRFQAKTTFHREGYTSQQDYGRFYNKNISFAFQNDLYSINSGDDNDNNNVYKNINSIIFSYNYNDTETYQSSISPETGYSLSLSYQHANHLIGSDDTFHKVLFDGRNYLPLSGKNQVLALRLVAGTATGELNKEELFYLGGNANNTSPSSVNRGSFPLRGFPSNAFSGNNLLSFSAEYRFPIKSVEKKIGFDWASVFLDRISGTLFLDAGNSWEGNFIPFDQNIHASAGAELHFKFKQARGTPLTLTIGAGKSLTGDSAFRFYFQTGISF